MSQSDFAREEVLFRQIHPLSLEKGVPSSDRFRPSAQDQNQMSVDRSALTTAAAAHALYVENGRRSAAVYGLNCGEFADEKVLCTADPLGATLEQKANEAHVLADYSAHADKAQKLLAKRLKNLAVARGCLFLAE